MPNAVVRLTIVALCLMTTILPHTAALAQSGSAGGSIGNDDKSLSGSRQDSREDGSVEPERPAHHSKPPAEDPRRALRSTGGGGNFDGAWTFVGTSTNCQGGASVTGVISGGRLIAPGISGSVSPNGAYHGVAVGNDGIRLTASGRLSGNSGGGTYSRSDGCVGRWIAAKQ